MKKLVNILLILFLLINFSHKLFAIESRFYNFKVMKEIPLKIAKNKGINLGNIVISSEKINEVYNFNYGGRVIVGYYLYNLDEKIEIFHTNKKLRGRKNLLIPEFNSKKRFNSKLGLNLNDENFIETKEYKIIKESINDILFLKDIETKIYRAKLLNLNGIDGKIIDDLKIYFSMYDKSKNNYGLSIISIIGIDRNNYIIETEGEDIGYGKSYILLLLKDGRVRKIFPFFYKKNNYEKLSTFFDYFSSSFLIINKKKIKEVDFDFKNRNIVSDKTILYFLFKDGKMIEENILEKNINMQLFRILNRIWKKVGKFKWSLSLDNEYIDLTRFYFRINLEFFKNGKIGESHISYVFEFDTNILSKM